MQEKKVELGNVELEDLTYPLGRCSIRGQVMEIGCSESQEFMDAIGESLPVPMVITRLLDGTVLYSNCRFRQTFGLGREKANGSHKVDLYIHPGEREILLRNLNENGSVSPVEVKLRKQDGTPVIATVSMRSLQFNGEAAILELFWDITTYHYTEHPSCTKPLLFDNLHDGVILTHLTGEIMDWNSAAERIFGYIKAEVVGKTLSEINLSLLSQTHQEPQQFPPFYPDSTFSGNQSYKLYYTRKDGYQGICETTLVPLRNSLGETISALLITHDLTEQQRSDQVEHQLLVSLQARASQQATVAHLGQQALAGLDLSDLMDTTVDLVAQTLDVDFCKILELMPSGHAFLMRSGVGWQDGLVGYAAVSAHANSLAGYTLLKNQSIIVDDLRVETRFSGPPLLHNHRIVSGVSVLIPGVEETCHQGKLEGNCPSSKPWGILSIHTRYYRKFTADDVHFLEAIANVLATAIGRHQSEERLHLMERAINSSRNGIVITDATQPDNPIIFVNSGFERITGYSKEEALGNNCRFLQGDEYNSPVIDVIRRSILEGKECQIEVKNFKKDGTPFWNELSISPVYNSRGHLTHFIGIQADITNRKASERALFLKSQALAKFSSNLKLLHRITTYNHQNVDELFRDYLQAGREIFKLSIGLISRVDGKHLFIHSSLTNLTELSLGSNFDLNQTYCGTVIATQQTITYPNVSLIDSLQDNLFYKKLKIKSYIGTPIFVRGKIYGTLSFSSQESEKESFEPHEQEIIELMAQTIGRFIAAQKVELQRAIAEKALRESEERYRRLVELSPEAIAVHCEDKIVYINPAGAKLLGAKTSQDLIGLSLLNFLYPESIKSVKQRILQIESDHNFSEWLDQKLIRLDGKIIDVEIAGIEQHHQGKAATQLIIRDITDRKRAEAQLIYDALHDALTELPNRTLFNERLRQALQRSKQQPNYLFAVLFLDLDRFKVVNDSLGHLVGDQLLIEVAQCLQKTVASTDTVARLGGDEFTILLENIQSCRDAIRMAEKINTELAQPFYVQGHEIFTTVSIGIVPSRSDGLNSELDPQGCQCLLYNNPEDFLRDADIAMYRAKARGKARYEVFDLSIHNQTQSLLQLENDLRQAIYGRMKKLANLPLPKPQNSYGKVPSVPLLSPVYPVLSGEVNPTEFIIYYQPIISLGTRTIVGFEALIRWIHPTRGLVSPAEFIPVTEETGLIIPLGTWVLRESCHQLSIWQEQLQRQFLSQKPSSSDLASLEPPKLTMSVNLSSKQLLQPNLLEQIDRILEETGCPPSGLKLEITESAIMENITTSSHILNQIRSKNIEVSIDDFGTGYSSLSYLHQLPFNSLKIDRSFITRLQTPNSPNFEKSGHPLQIVRAIISLAHNLGLEVVAEGIETPEQVKILQDLNCELGQGYLFSKPVDPVAATRLLLENTIDIQPL